MSPGHTFDRVYAALKQRLVAGAIAPGEPLEPAALGDQLNASITPVRDALHRLVGERLVETPRHNGFTVPNPTEAQLRDLFAWHEALLGLALARIARAGPSSALVLAPPQGPPTAAGLVAALARRCGSAELEAALLMTSDRLAGLSVAETSLFDDLGDEAAGLWQAFVRNEWPGLRRALAAYHRRRRRNVEHLLALMRAYRTSPDQPG